ncbi:hypothetical protein L7F22_025117 [Adiantum nelumboides]|nr:hypothetical protein [Adiantum nelumboides]
MKQFLASVAKDKVLTKWRSLKLSPYESIHKYVDKFWDVNLKSTIYKKIDFEEQKQQFCAGLPEDINEYVNSQRPRSILAVIHHTIVAARINFQQGAKRNLKPMEAKEKQEYKGKNFSQNSSKGNSNNNKAKEKGDFKGKNKITPKELERYRKENKCFKCGEQGHSYRSCLISVYMIFAKDSSNGVNETQNLMRFEYPKLARFCQTHEEFAEVHGLSQSGKLWKRLSAGDLPESEWLTVFDTPKYKGSKIFLNMVKPQFVVESKADVEAHKIAWALFAVILSLKHNLVAWKRKNELKEKKVEFLNKRDALIRREATASAASMIQTKIMSLQTRYETLKGANSTAKQLAAVEAKITAMSNAVKLIEGDDKIADMKIVVESIELGCNERIIETIKSMLVGHNPRASPYFREPTVSNVKTKVSSITNKLAYVELLTVVSYSFHHFAKWSDVEAAHHMSFETDCGYTKNLVGVEEGNVFDLGIASPGGAEKSWSKRKAAKNVGHDTVPPKSTVLGATSEEGVEAILGGNTDVESIFLAKFVKRFKSNKRTATTTAPGEDYERVHEAQMTLAE